MSQRVEQVSQWVYEGLWGVLTRWFRVPAQPPILPALAGEAIQSFRPAQGFLRYLKFQFWIALIVIDTLLVIGWLALGVAEPLAGVLITPLALFLIIAPNVVAYLAIHLRFDTTWYVLSDRSLRIRRGIWIIHETTITFENVQNVTINQGPLQRWFGIADVVVETAGGSGGRGEQHAGTAAGHQGLIEGLDQRAADSRSDPQPPAAFAIGRTGRRPRTQPAVRGSRLVARPFGLPARDPRRRAQDGAALTEPGGAATKETATGVFSQLQSPQSPYPSS